jgi:hypothetical protein
MGKKRGGNKQTQQHQSEEAAVDDNANIAESNTSKASDPPSPVEVNLTAPPSGRHDKTKAIDDNAPKQEELSEEDTTTRRPLDDAQEREVSSIPSRSESPDVPTEPAATENSASPHADSASGAAAATAPTSDSSRAASPARVMQPQGKVSSMKKKASTCARIQCARESLVANVITAAILIRALAVALTVWATIVALQVWEAVDRRAPKVAAFVVDTARQVREKLRHQAGVPEGQPALEYARGLLVVDHLTILLRKMDKRLARGRVEREIRRLWADASGEFSASCPSQLRRLNLPFFA